MLILAEFSKCILPSIGLYPQKPAEQFTSTIWTDGRWAWFI